MTLKADIVLEGRSLAGLAVRAAHQRQGADVKLSAHLDYFGAPRLPAIMQSEAAECGLACLAMVATYHGREVDLTAPAPPVLDLTERRDSQGRAGDGPAASA